MIEISKEYILLDGAVTGKAVDFLWESMEVAGKRFVGVIINLNRKKVEYDGDFQLIKKDNVGMGIFKITSREQLAKFTEMVQSSINDYYIVMNSLFDEVKEKIFEGRYVKNESFDNELFLHDYPRTFYVYTDKLFIDLEVFRDYDYSLKRVAQRYSQKI